MLCRNIDITLGLVNGAIGTVRSVKYSIDQAGMVESISVDFGDDKLHQLTELRANSKYSKKPMLLGNNSQSLLLTVLPYTSRRA